MRACVRVLRKKWDPKQIEAPCRIIETNEKNATVTCQEINTRSSNNTPLVRLTVVHRHLGSVFARVCYAPPRLLVPARPPDK